MTGWRWLPNELKFKIIKYMDFLTRFRFRHTARSSLIVVDAIPTFIPRIHLNFVNHWNFCLLLFESTSLVREFWFSKNGCSMITYNPSTISAKKLPLAAPPAPKLSSKKKKKRSKYNLLPEPIQNFIYALKTITSGRRTFGGIDIFGSTLYDHPVDVMDLLKGCRIHARILTFENHWVALPILMKCFNVLEIHNPRYEEEIRFNGTTRQNKERVICSRVSWMKFKSKQKCSYYTVVYRYNDGDVRDDCGAMYQRLPSSEPDQYIIPCPAGQYKMKYKIKLFKSPCGFVNRKSPIEYIEEQCQRRRACKKHSDPFEYWYFNEKRTFFDGKAVVVRSGWNKYENILPVVNGVCPVQEFLDKREKMMEEWKERRKRGKYRWGDRSKIVKYGNRGRKG